MVHLVINDTELVLAIIYAPTRDNKQEQLTFFKYIHDILVHFMGKSIILGGDFNTYLNPSLDKSGGVKEEVSETSKVLLNMCDELGLFDVYRSHNPEGKRFTWRNKGKPGLVQSRLDMFIVSEELQYLDIKFSVIPGLLSDHSLIQIDFDTDRHWTRGRGFWKFNVQLLKYVNYVKLINSQLDEFNKTYHSFENTSLQWDFIKCKLRGATISYASFKAMEQRRNEKHLQKKLSELELNLGMT